MKFVPKMTAKIIFIALLILLLLVPIAMISAVISERESQRYKAIAEVSRSWGLRQTITGPILTIPYRETWKDEENKTHTQIRRVHFLPEQLQVEGNLLPDVRYRGIYEVVLYRAALKIRGAFSHPDFQQWKISGKDVLWDEAFISVGIPDMRGIKKEVGLVWNQQKLSFHPGVNGMNLYDSGMHAGISELKAEKSTDRYNFEFDLALNGSRYLYVLPLGKETNVNLSSSWAHPSFIGAFLPTSRVVNKDGFKATWDVTYFGRTYPQQWKEGKNLNYTKYKSELTRSEFGVRLLYPVDAYKKSERSVKYGILFVILTFLAFFLFEVLSSLKIHPLQYLLVGFAICLFYLLLISISEHMDFLVAYIIASISIVFLISGYVSKILQSKKRAAVIGGILVALYIFLYILLQIQDYALLLGTVGLFLILAFVMYLTRGIDWYTVGQTTANESEIKEENLT